MRWSLVAFSAGVVLAFLLLFGLPPYTRAPTPEPETLSVTLSPTPCPIPRVPTCSCPALEAEPKVPSNDGQVTLSTSFGKYLYGLALRPDVATVLEIGTWYGGGSTLCIATGLHQNVSASGKKKMLWTIELFEPAWNYARKKLKSLGLPVRCLLGGTVPAEDYLKESEIPAAERGEHFSLYYRRDLALAAEAEPLLKPLCLARQYDMVLIDGNEYSGWAEFQVVDSVCRPRLLALHDVGTLKTNKIVRHLSEREDWTLMASGADAAKWAVYQRKG